MKQYEFNYKGSSQKITLPKGEYRIECRGGGSRGGYVSGYITLTKQQTFYIEVGGDPYNGGGETSNQYGISGYGATDVRTIDKDLYSRFIVAGGQGGSAIFFTKTTNRILDGGHAGADTGSSGNSAYSATASGLNKNPSDGGTQKDGGSGGNIDKQRGQSGQFGIGGTAGAGEEDKPDNLVKPGGGGGGWYGGGGGGGLLYQGCQAGGGGSNYVLTSESYKPSGYKCGEDLYMRDVINLSGFSEKIPSYMGSSKVLITAMVAEPVIKILEKNSKQIKIKATSETGEIGRVEIYINNILKQTSRDNFEEVVFNFNIEDPDYIIGKNEIKIIAYDDIYGLNTTYIDDYKYVLSPPTLPINPSIIEIIETYGEIDSYIFNQMNTLKQQLIEKGVDATDTDTLTDLIFKIDNIGNGGFPEWSNLGNTWISATPLKKAKLGLTSSAVKENIYCIGGHVEGRVGHNDCYNAKENTWTTKTDMPTKRDKLVSGVVNNKIYCIGNSNLNNNECYDVITDTWTTKANMPTERYRLTSSVVNNKIYCIGGANNNGVALGSNECYNPKTNSWETKRSMTKNKFGLTSSVVNNNIYCIGGKDSNLNECYIL